MKRIADFFRFDKPQEEFELLETECGEIHPLRDDKEPPITEKRQDQKPSSKSLRENEDRLKAAFKSEINPDVLFRRFLIGSNVQAHLVCINGMASGEQVNNYILRQAMRPDCMKDATENKARFAVANVFAQQEAAVTSDWSAIKKAIIEGRTAVFIDGDDSAILMDTRGYADRGVGVAENEKTVRGPKESFNENLRTNITLLRRIIRTEDFVCEFQNAGGGNNVSLVIAYRAELVNPRLLREVKKRLGNIRARMILSNGTIEQLTERRRLSPVPQVLSTERPDRTAAHILNGHVAVLVDGSPSANVLPATLFTLMNTSEDAYMRRPLSIMIKAVRYFGALVGILLPGYFIAVALHHQGMLSMEVVTTVIASRQMVFLPLGVEMLFLLWVFQLLREAGIRVPGSAGQAIGIIGGLILGQAAVAANMVSTVVLILVALCGLGVFTIPDYSAQIAAEYFRLFLFLLGWAGGLLAYFLGILLACAWLSCAKSYGVPFLTPVAPKTNVNTPGIWSGRQGKRMRATDYTNTKEELP